MIRLDKYNSKFEETYWTCVENKIDVSTREQIINSCRRFLPPDFFYGNNEFQELVLAPYEKLSSAQRYIEKHTREHMNAECFDYDIQGRRIRNELFDKLYKAYDKIYRTKVGKNNLNVEMIYQLGITVCPYCNRAYINYRGATISGAQLDHFFPRDAYPIFSVCLYNLVPSCDNCNRLKSNKSGRFASPFDDKIDWENSVHFCYWFMSENNKKIIIKSRKPIKHNIQNMKIDEAYQIHVNDVEELLEKKQIYCQTQLKEFREVLKRANISEQELKKMVFGPPITPQQFKTKPLSKMMHDLYKELQIYE